MSAGSRPVDEPSPCRRAPRWMAPGPRRAAASSLHLHTCAPVQTTHHVAFQFRIGRGGSRRQRPHHHRAPCRERPEAGCADRAQATLHQVPLNRAANGLGHNKTHPSRLGSGGSSIVHHDSWRAAAGTEPDRVGELVTVTHPVLCRQHRAQADSALRPLRRRAARIERPARVRIRSRKPCTLARRRLFGWKVRLLTGMLQKMLGRAPSPGKQGAEPFEHGPPGRSTRASTRLIHGTRGWVTRSNPP